METEKIYLNGEEFDLVVKIPEEMIESNIDLTDQENDPLFATLDLTNDLKGKIENDF